MAISKLLIEKIFDSIWETWINKDGARAAAKAVEHFLNSGENKDDLIRACEIYRLENQGQDPSFTYKLSNFINGDHWQDILEGNMLEHLQRRNDEAIALIKAWNETCAPHWCKVIDIDAKIPMAIKALNDKSFNKEWKKALAKARRIFKYEFRDSDTRSKIILSFRWFTNIVYDKHTVLRIMEGEYGHPIKDPCSSKTEIIMPQSEEEKLRLKQDFEEVFGRKLEPIIKPEKETKPREPSKQAKEIAAQIAASVGLTTLVQSEPDDGIEFV